MANKTDKTNAKPEKKAEKKAGQAPEQEKKSFRLIPKRAEPAPETGNEPQKKKVRVRFTRNSVAARASHESRLTRLKAEVRAKKAEVQSKKAEIKAKKAEIRDKEAEIRAKRAEIRAKEAEIRSLRENRPGEKPGILNQVKSRIRRKESDT